jgi:hypothetical protein
MTRTLPAWIILLTLLLAACGVAVIVPTCNVEPLDQFPVDSVVIETHGRSYPFKVWVADTVNRRSQGLMYVSRLDADRGMLFLFDRPTRPSMWMKNMAFPIDLLFISADGRIITVARNATPDSTITIQSDDVVTGVIELAGGTATRLHLETGAHISHAHFVRLAKQTLPSPGKSSPLRTARN